MEANLEPIETPRILTEDEISRLAVAAHRYTNLTGEHASQFADLLDLTARQKLTLLGACATVVAHEDATNQSPLHKVESDAKPEPGIISDHFKSFKQNARKTPLLTAAQEVSLGRRIQTGTQDGLEAKQALVEANLLLVASEAMRYYRGYPKAKQFGLMDLVQEGTFGLIRATEKYDPEAGFKFSTYAVGWIRSKIQNALQDKADVTRIPRHAHDKIRTMNSLATQGASDQDIMAAMDISQAELDELRQVVARRNTRSLDEPVGDGEGTSKTRRGDLIADNRAEQAFERLFDETTKQKEITDPAEQAPSVWSVLEPLLSKSNLGLLAKIMNDEDITETDMRQKLRLNGLFAHPAIRAELLKIKLPNLDGGEDWRNEAACIGEAEIITKKGALKAEQKKHLTHVCGGCAVRAACRRHFIEKRPELGRWSGHNFNTLKNAKKRAKNKAPR